ncbi:Hypothetical protein NCS54_00347400 [Fusarium falciforme]|uniref:Hypothetical protein n=1 Tax=Fusarium falciforme TaxID=195108 RepID=UPI00230035F7|nr:Hypothetical protein NCS54_00347400 [Fusarium falciforme]WAO86209.1 Hypothetical protein NCS54_00347400 [Fusarium falciforme]
MAPPSTDNTNPAEAPVDFHHAQHWASLRAGGASEEDSTVEDDSASSSDSISSSILHYQTIHGRTYHSERGNAQYWTPNDEHHNESMDINHHLLSLSLNGKLHLAPLKNNIKKVVDIGTGTGKASPPNFHDGAN